MIVIASEVELEIIDLNRFGNRIESNRIPVEFDNVWPSAKPCQQCVPVGNKTDDNRAIL